MQYLIPTPEGQQPDLKLVALVIDGHIIPASEVTNPASLTITTITSSENAAPQGDTTQVEGNTA